MSVVLCKTHHVHYQQIAWEEHKMTFTFTDLKNLY